MLVEFLAQGMHFACSMGKDVYPEAEVHALADMYERREAGITVSDFVHEVRPSACMCLCSERPAPPCAPLSARCAAWRLACDQ